MSSRHQPLNGADSAEALTRKPYLVLLEDEAGGRIQVRVPKAMGPNDARNQARLDNPDYDPIHTELDASHDYAESEEMRAREAVS